MFKLDLPTEIVALMGGLLVLATWRDLRYHRIDNWITFPAALLAILLYAYNSGLQGAGISILGLGIGLLLLLPFYIYGGMAAGDVKLMAAVGACLGYQTIFWATMYSLVAGSLLALFLLAAKGDLITGLGHMCRQIRAFSFTRVWVAAGSMPTESNNTIAQRFPYAAAITTGCLVLLFWGTPQGI